MMLRPVTRRLACSCGSLLGDATYRPWPGNLVVRGLDGGVQQPESVAIQLRRVDGALAGGSDPSERTALEARRDYLRRNLSEIVYELRCPQGHVWVRSMPDLVRRIRRQSGDWVDVA